MLSIRPQIGRQPSLQPLSIPDAGKTAEEQEPQDTPEASPMKVDDGRRASRSTGRYGARSRWPPDNFILEWNAPSGPWMWDGTHIPDNTSPEAVWDYLVYERGVTAGHACLWRGCKKYGDTVGRKLQRHVASAHLGATLTCLQCGHCTPAEGPGAGHRLHKAWCPLTASNLKANKQQATSGGSAMLTEAH